MRWLFWKKPEPTPPPKREPLRLKVPPQRELEIRELYDQMAAIKAGADNAARYRLWDAIAEMFPQTTCGNWRIEFVNSMSTEIVEIVK